jgi:hypothetical protein
MKFNASKWIAILAFAGIAMTAPSAKAVSFSAGDLIMGVRDSSGSSANVYLIDLGNLPVASGQIGSSIAADLTALYGSGWYGNSSLDWGIFGYTGTNTLVVGQGENSLGTQASGYGAITTANRNIVKGLFNNVATAIPTPSGQYVSGSTLTGGGQFVLGGTSISTSGVAVLNSASNGYASFQPNWSNFLAGYENSGFTGTAEDMFTVTGTGSTYGGTFYVTSDGAVMFSTTASVATPEAGNAFALMSLGLGCLLPLRRFTRRA